ncbi:MAG: M20/M25/M40 family metallo-hydrolase [Dehalococcoidia bacterium]|nr:M20/M25/M40 family metallo-hydrolase [Dehalococcoidia bacterium]
MKPLPKSLTSQLLLLFAAATVAVLVACSSEEAPPPVAAAPTEIVAPPTATAARPTATVEAGPTATPRPSPTPMPMMPTQTPLPRPTATPAPVAPSALADEVFETLQELTDEYSPRESATDEELEAAQHLRGRLSDLGYETSIQEFGVTLPNAMVELVLPTGDAPESPRSVPIAASVQGIATGLLTYVDRAFEDDIPSEGLDGRIALIERGDITFEEKVKRVADAGAVGAIIFNNQEGLFFGRFANQPSIPAVAISQADGRELRDLVEQDDLGATVSVGDETSPSRNVIADMRTSTGSDRTVIVGAHYDTVPNSQGASDNGSGISTVLTIAEHISDRDYPFNVRVILFGAEEIGLFGSRHYVENMSKDEVDNTIAMLNFDAFGSGRTLQAAGDIQLTGEATRIGSNLGMNLGTFSEDPITGRSGWPESRCCS